MLATVVGQARVDTELADASELARRCGYLPLALRILSARLVARPHWPVSLLTARLSDERRQLAELEHQNLDVRASLRVSMEQLINSDDDRDREAARGADLLARGPGPDLSTLSGAALLGVEPAVAESRLERLVDNGLLETAAPGHYRFHDLIRTYLRQQPMTAQGEAAYRAALRRLLQKYSQTGWQVAQHISGVDERSAWHDSAALGPIQDLGEAAETMIEWLHGQQPHILDLAGVVADLGAEFDPWLIQLAAGLMPINLNQAAYDEQLALTDLAIVAAQRLGDPAALGLATHDRGAALAERSLLDDSVLALESALAVFRSAGDRRGEAMVQRNLCFIYGVLDRLDDGLSSGLQALEITETMQPPVRLAQCYMLLGSIYSRRGEALQELAHFEKALTTLQAENQPNRKAFALKHIGAAHRRAGRLELSAELLHESIRSAESQGQLAHRIVALVELARTKAAMGDVAAALASAATAHNLAQEAGIQSLQARALHAIGDTLAGHGQPQLARMRWQAALDLYRELGAAGAVMELEDLLDDRPPRQDNPTLWHDTHTPPSSRDAE